jgi:CheY-like chemotaxis protein
MLKHILIVEDDEVTSFLTKTVVKSSGVTESFTLVKNGLEALHFLKENDTDLVLLDIYMPVLDGQGFLEAFKKTYPSRFLRVVILSSSDRKSEMLAWSRFKEVIHYEMKPLRIESMHRICHAVERNA